MNGHPTIGGGFLAFLDTETTGLDPVRHPIWEIAVVTDDGGPDTPAYVESWQVRLPDPVIAQADPEALRINHFHERYDPTNALDLPDTVERLYAMLHGRHVVGAVPSFDMQRIGMMFDMVASAFPFFKDGDNYVWNYHLIDVESMALGWLAAHNRLAPIRASLAALDQSGDAGNMLADEMKSWAVESPPGDDPAAWALRVPFRFSTILPLLGVDSVPEELRHTAAGDAMLARDVFYAIVGGPVGYNFPTADPEPEEDQTTTEPTP